MSFVFSLVASACYGAESGVLKATRNQRETGVNETAGGLVYLASMWTGAVLNATHESSGLVDIDWRTQAISENLGLFQKNTNRYKQIKERGSLTSMINQLELYRVVRRLTALAAALVMCAASYCQAPQSTDIFAHRKFTEVKLNGLTVRLGDPIQVTAQLGWKTSADIYDWYSFIHVTPTMARFPNGELIAAYPLDPDSQNNPAFLSAFQISKDGGAHWGTRYSVLMQHIPMIYVPDANNSLLAIPSEMMYTTQGDERNFRGPYLRFEQGGKRMVMEPDGVHVLDWPWPVGVGSSPQPKSNWHVGFTFLGSAVRVNGQLLAAVQWSKKGEPLTRVSLAASKDDGHTWRYYSTIVTPSDIHPQKQDWPEMERKGFEGPNENSIVQLADGELMAVFRTGSFTPWKLWRAYSKDGGLTWSKADMLPAYSVEPNLLRIANGTIVLSTGRPGIGLWLSTDPRARTWRMVDIVARHNSWAPDPSYRIDQLDREHPMAAIAGILKSVGVTGAPECSIDPNNPDDGLWRSTGYTGIVQLAPNRLLLIYDRSPERAPANPQDLSRIFVMPIEVVR